MVHEIGKGKRRVANNNNVGSARRGSKRALTNPSSSAQKTCWSATRGSAQPGIDRDARHLNYMPTDSNPQLFRPSAFDRGP